jgi:hypothetical protein
MPRIVIQLFLLDKKPLKPGGAEDVTSRLKKRNRKLAKIWG